MFEFGDKNGRLLAWLARGQTSSTHIAGIRDGGGQLITSPEDINDRFSQFYQEVYSSRNRYSSADLQDYLDGIAFPTLAKEYRKNLEADITLEEVQAAIVGLQSGKTPGVDGLPTEFFSQHIELLAPRLTVLLAEFARVPCLTLWQRPSLCWFPSPVRILWNAPPIGLFPC